MRIRTKLKLHYLRYWLKHKISFGGDLEKAKYWKDDQRKVWIFLGADYGNLGDVAITLSQERFLKNLYNEAEIITVPISETLNAIPKIKSAIRKDDIVTIVGGGNISDLYEDIEFLRQLVIKSFPNNKIISFPQSVYLTNTSKGEEERKRIKKIYGGHKDLLILMRDKVSFQRMKRILPNSRVKLAPDTVMLEDFRKDADRKKKVLVCLRRDKESAASANDGIYALIEELEKKDFEIIRSDTQIDDVLVRRDGGERHLNKFLNEICESSLVITDRLHGMIFAFITGTPAIVKDNSTGKVSATYEWIKDCGFIILKDANTNIDIDKLSFNHNFEKVHDKVKELLYDTLN